MPYISLRSHNLPDHFVRHQNFLGEIHQVATELERNDATFFVADADPADSRPVMLRSVNFPLHVLRHQDFRIKLHEYNPPLIPPPELGGFHETPEQRLLREDATFFVVRGLADPGGVSFRSFNFPDRFLRHREFHLFVEAVPDELGRNDATWHVAPPFAPPDPIILH